MRGGQDEHQAAKVGMKEWARISLSEADGEREESLAIQAIQMYFPPSLRPRSEYRMVRASRTTKPGGS